MTPPQSRATVWPAALPSIILEEETRVIPRKRHSIRPPDANRPPREVDNNTFSVPRGTESTKHLKQNKEKGGDPWSPTLCFSRVTVTPHLLGRSKGSLECIVMQSSYCQQCFQIGFSRTQSNLLLSTRRVSSSCSERVSIALAAATCCGAWSANSNNEKTFDITSFALFS